MNSLVSNNYRHNYDSENNCSRYKISRGSQDVRFRRTWVGPACLETLRSLGIRSTAQSLILNSPRPYKHTLYSTYLCNTVCDVKSAKTLRSHTMPPKNPGQCHRQCRIFYKMMFMLCRPIILYKMSIRTSVSAFPSGIPAAFRLAQSARKSKSIEIRIDSNCCRLVPRGYI